MSKARKCDRCGKFYDEYQADYHVTMKKGAYNCKSLDLCPDCTNKLIKWLDKLQTEAIKQ